MDIREQFKSRKFILLFSMVSTAIAIIISNILKGFVTLEFEIIILPVLSLLWGPIAVLGFCIMESVNFLINYPNNPFNALIIILIFISYCTVWKLWYSTMNKNGKEFPNMNNLYNLIKILLIFAAHSLIMLTFGEIIYAELTHINKALLGFIFTDTGLLFIPASYCLTIIVLGIVHHFKIPTYAPKKQFKQIFPKKAYPAMWIILIFIGIFYYMINQITGWHQYLGLISILCVLLYLLKPYDEDVFKIKDEPKNNIFNKIHVSIILTLVIMLIILTSFPIISFSMMDLFVSFLLHNTFYIFLLLIAPILIYLYFLEKKVTSPINKLSEILSKKISTRDDYLEHKKNLKSINVNNEIKILIDTLLSMESDLIEYGEHLVKVTSENERYKTELKLASEIQNSMIPKDFEEFCNNVNASDEACQRLKEEKTNKKQNLEDNKTKKENYDNTITKHKIELRGFIKPVHEIRGDFYDYFQIDKDNIGFVIGDVDEKGVSATLIMVKAMTLIEDYTKEYNDLSKVFYDVNNLIYEDNAENIHVDSWLGKVNIKTGELSFVNAGYINPLIRLDNAHEPLQNNEYKSNFEYLNAESTPALASSENNVYKTHTIKLNKGDGLLICTNGIIEASNPYDETYGEKRLKDCLNRHQDYDLSIIIDRIEKEIEEVRMSEKQKDDETIFILRIK